MYIDIDGFFDRRLAVTQTCSNDMLDGVVVRKISERWGTAGRVLIIEEINPPSLVALCQNLHILIWVSSAAA